MGWDGKERLQRGHEDMFIILVEVDGFTGMYTYQNLLSCTLQICPLYCMSILSKSVFTTY